MRGGPRLWLGVTLVALIATAADLRAQNAQVTGTNPAAKSGSTLKSAADALFADAVAKEGAVRKVLGGRSPAETVLKAVRTVVADYESLVRNYPSSSFCDDALWRAAKLAGDAFAVFRDPSEQGVSMRLFQTLIDKYSSSKFAKQAPSQLAAVRSTKAGPPVKSDTAAANPAAATGPNAAVAAPPAAPTGRTPQPNTNRAPAREARRPAETTPAASRSTPPNANARATGPVAPAAPVETAASRSTSSDTVPTAVDPSPAKPTVEESVAPIATTPTTPIGATPTTPVRTTPISPPPAAASPTPFPGKIATIKAIRRAVLTDVIRVVIELDMEVHFHDERLDGPPRVFVDLPSTRAVDALKDQTLRFETDADLVRQVRIGRHPNNTTRVVLDASGVSSYSVYPLYNPYRLVIDCMRPTPVVGLAATPPFPAMLPPAPLPARTIGGVATAPRLPLPLPPPSLPVLAARAVRGLAIVPHIVPTTFPFSAPAPVQAAQSTLPAAPVTTAAVVPAPPEGAPSANLAGGYSIARQLGLGVSRIVIDPGHGGHDPGTRGGGTTEAELVLDIALRLEKLLAKVAGVAVVLTRREDEFVPLQERTAIANRESADLFLSIHANANNSAQIQGVETYFLNFATNLSAAAVAARENAASGQSMGELPDVVKTIALNNKIDESRDFATFVQREMLTKLKPANKSLRDLGVKQAPFVVLIGAAMPSVLAEVAFMTNPQEARLLKTPAYRQRIADALFQAIREYQAALKKTPALAQQSQQN